MNVRLQDKPGSSHEENAHFTTYDAFQRPLRDLRISLIDQCNFRCTYCMPKESHEDRYTFLSKNDWLTFDEIKRVTRLFAQLGVTKLRLTGGEPLLRPNLPDLIEDLKNISSIEDIALTTNGSLLEPHAEALKEAGLDRITVSLDALDNNLFRTMNGKSGHVDKVLAGIKKCEEIDFPCIKINTVIQKGVNDHQILDLVDYFKGRKPILRFIEYMDVGNCNHWDARSVVPSIEILSMINNRYPIEPISANYYGEVASRYRYLDNSGEVGFISSITQPFCQNCTRARLSADGKFYTCLFAKDGTNLQNLLRTDASDDQILKTLRSVWCSRKDRYSELRSQMPFPGHASQKVEMYQIGG